MPDTSSPYRPPDQSLPDGELLSLALMDYAWTGHLANAAEHVGFQGDPLTPCMSSLRCGKGRLGPLTCISKAEGHNPVLKFLLEKCENMLQG